MKCFDLLLAIAPFGIGLVVYVVRLERRLTKISIDLCWIKKLLKGMNCIKTETETEN